MEGSSTIDTVRLFTFSDIQKMFDLKQKPYTAIKNYEREISVLEDQIIHLESLVQKAEDERDHYKHILMGCI